MMRLVAGVSLIAHGFMRVRTGPAIEPMLLGAFAITLGAILFAGLWTPIAGALVAVLELWAALTRYRDPSIHVLLGTLGAALALIGPGAWSVDARLFGWKRIDIPDRKS